MDGNILKTVEDYSAEYMPEDFMCSFRELASRHKSGLLSESMYYDAVNAVMNEISDEIMKGFNALLCDEFEMRDCLFSRHFLSRLLARFSESVMSFMMTRIRRLFYQCCKHGRERGRDDGIVLVVNPVQRELITIFVC